MDALLPELLLTLDLLGLGLALWLMLYPLSSTWRGYRRQVQPSLLALGALALLFAMAVYDGLWGMALKANPTVNSMRLLLLPLPLAWVLLAWSLQPAALRGRYRWTLGVALTLLLLAAGATVGPVLLLPAYLPNSWVFLPFYLVALVGSLGLAMLLVLRARALPSGAQEQQARATLLLASPLLLGGAALLAGDVVFGLENPPLLAYTEGLVGQIRLTASASLLLGTVALARTMLLQARGAGMARSPEFARAFLLMGFTLLLYMAVGLGALWYWRLPADLLAVFLLLALLTEGINRARLRLHQSATHLDPVDRVPPVVRPLLAQLARQLHSPQLGLALREGNDYRIVVALNPSWEKEILDVSDPHVWEERSVGGWNKPLKLQGQTIGILASERTGPLSPAQAQLLDDATTHLAQLIHEWQELAKRRDGLHKVIEEYRQQAQLLESKQALLLTRPSNRKISPQEVSQLLSQFHAPDNVLGTLPLARLNVVEKVLPATQRNVEGRAQMLRDLISQLVEQLRPLESAVPTHPTREWYPYLILHDFYLEKQTEAELLAHLEIGQSEYARAHRAGLEAIAATLAELEAGIAQSEAGRGDALGPMAPAPARGSSAGRTGAGYGTGKGSGYAGSSGYGSGSGSGGRSEYADRTAEPQRTSHWQQGGASSHATTQKHAPVQPGRNQGTTQQRNPLTSLTERFRGRGDQPATPPAIPPATADNPRTGVLGTITSFFKREAKKDASDEPTASKLNRPISPDDLPPEGAPFPTSPTTPLSGGPRPGSQVPHDEGRKDRY